MLLRKFSRIGDVRKYRLMLTIRFIRRGKKNQPFFRIVVTDKKNPPKGGRFLEILGFFNPLTKEKSLKLERVKYWLSVGAQPSNRVYNLLVSEKIIQGKKMDVHKKSKKKREEKLEEPKKEEGKSEKLQPEEKKTNVSEETKEGAREQVKDDGKGDS